MKSSFLIKFLPLSPLFVLLACTRTDFDSPVLQRLTPYKPVVVQGSLITRENVEQLRLGMTREEVADLLGQPSLHDVFHAHQWRYYSAIYRGATPSREQSRCLVLDFEDNRLAKISHDTALTENEWIEQVKKLSK